MDRLDYYYKQPVTDGELDLGFANAEVADRNLAIDNALFGIASGMVVSQHTAPDLTVNVSTGVGNDAAGQRVFAPSTQNVNVAVDNGSVTTAVTTPGNSKVVSVFAKFKRALSDPRIDGNSATVYFHSDESFDFYVTQGTEAATGTETPPPLEADKILLADIRRTQGVTTIVNSEINPYATNRRQDMFAVAGTPHSIRRGTILAAIADLVGFANTTSGDVTAAIATAEAYADAGDAATLTTAENFANAQIAALAVPLTAEGAANGVATLDGSSLLTAGQRVGWIVDSQTAILTSDQAFTGAAYTDVTGLAVTLTAVAGDVLLIDADLVTVNSASGSFGEYGTQVVVVDGGTPSAPNEGRQDVTGSTVSTYRHRKLRYVVANTGSVTVKIQAKTLPAGGTITVEGTSLVLRSTLTVMQYRP